MDKNKVLICITSIVCCLIICTSAYLISSFNTKKSIEYSGVRYELVNNWYLFDKKEAIIYTRDSKNGKWKIYANFSGDYVPYTSNLNWDSAK